MVRAGRARRGPRPRGRLRAVVLVGAACTARPSSKLDFGLETKIACRLESE